MRRAGRGGAPAPGRRAGRQSPALLTNVKRCISVGPFRDVSEAAHAASTLRGGGYDPRQRVADGEVWAGVWVYLPLPASRPAADQTLGQTQGRRDRRCTGNARAQRRVGDFSGALQRTEARPGAGCASAGVGIQSGIADRKRTGNVYWIDIDLKPTDSLLNPSDLQGESGRIVRLEVKGCPSAGAAMKSANRGAARYRRHRRHHRLWLSCRISLSHRHASATAGFARESGRTSAWATACEVGLTALLRQRRWRRTDSRRFLHWLGRAGELAGLAQGVRGDSRVAGAVRREHCGQLPVHLLPRSTAAASIAQVADSLRFLSPCASVVM